MDVATNSEFFGYDVSRKFWLKQVNCQNHSSDDACPVHTLFNPPTAPQFDPSKKEDVTNAPMICQNNGPWHLGISAEACENAGGEWFRTPCVTLKETIDNRPSQFDLDAPMNGDCQYNLDRLETAYVSVSTTHANFIFTNDKGNDVDRCAKFCESLPNYHSQNSMMVKRQTAKNEKKHYCGCQELYLSASE